MVRFIKLKSNQTKTNFLKLKTKLYKLSSDCGLACVYIFLIYFINIPELSLEASRHTDFPKICRAEYSVFAALQNPSVNRFSSRETEPNQFITLLKPNQGNQAETDISNYTDGLFRFGSNWFMAHRGES